MIDLAIAVAVAAVAAAGLFCLEVARVLRKRLADRVARWVLPDGQPMTFRLAVVFATLARRIAPREYVVERVEPPADTEGARLCYRVDLVDWPEAVGALAELEADLRSDHPVAKPVRLVLPVVRFAVRRRFRRMWGALHRPRSIELVATDRSIRMVVPKAFVAHVPSLVTISPADPPSTEATSTPQSA